MKKLALGFSLLCTINVFANYDFSDHEAFCENSYLNSEKSKTAVANGGKYQNGYKKLGKRTVPRMVQYRGCRFDVEWMEQTRDLICENEKTKSEVGDLSFIKIPDEIIFIFDGAGDFDANLGLNSLGASNIDGSEGEDVWMGNFNGGILFSKVLRGTNHNGNREIHYHSSSGLHSRENYSSAVSCAEEVIAYKKILNDLGKKTDSKWIVMGFSNGGQLSTEFQYDMGAIGQSIDLSISVDPVEQALFYFPSKLSKTVGDKKHRLTKRMVNFYQDTDYNSIQGFKLRGKPVKGADENLHITSDIDYKLNEDGYHNHLRIARSNIVESLIKCELNNISIDSNENCNYSQYQND